MVEKIVGAVAAALLATVIQSANAATVITFDNLTSQTVVTNQYSGVAFSGAEVLGGGDLNSFYYPPYSAANVITNNVSDTITLSFSQPVNSVGAFATGGYGVTEVAYDGLTQVGTSNTGGPNYTGVGTPNIFLNVSSPTITSVIFTDYSESSNFFTLDNVTISPTLSSTVPEPSTWAMMLLGFSSLGFMAYRRKSNRLA